MELLDYLIANIMALPWVIKGPGLFFIFSFLLKSIGHVFRLRLIAAITNFLLSLIIALILARWGVEIAIFVQEQLNMSAPQSDEHSHGHFNIFLERTG